MSDFPVGKFFHYLFTEATLADSIRDWEDPRNPLCPQLDDPRHQGVVDRDGGDVLFVRLFSWLDGTTGPQQALPKGDWSRWRFYDTDSEMRIAYAEHGYRRGWWDRSNTDWIINQERPQGRSKAKAKAKPSSARRQAFRSGLTKAKRFDILQRGGFRCRWCGRPAGETTLEVDHILPISAGGTDDLDNLAPSCGECNAGKRDKVVTP